MKINRREFVRNSTIATIGLTLPTTVIGRKNQTGEANLYNKFLTPSASARPFVRWWWNGDGCMRVRSCGSWIC